MQLSSFAKELLVALEQRGYKKQNGNTVIKGLGLNNVQVKVIVDEMFVNIYLITILQTHIRHLFLFEGGDMTERFNQAIDSLFAEASEYDVESVKLK